MTQTPGLCIGNQRGPRVKDMTLRPEGSDSEFIGVIVLNRPFYTVFYATPSEGLPRLVKTPIYLLNENVLNKKLEHFYNILKKSVDMKIYIFILYYMYVMFF